MTKIKFSFMFLIVNMALGISQARSDESANSCDATTTSMLECNKKDLASEDKRLNDLYKQLRAKVGHGSTAEKYLIEAQRAWVNFRDANCKYEGAEFEGGTMQGVAVTACSVEQTKKRNEQLQHYLDHCCA